MRIGEGAALGARTISVVVAHKYASRDGRRDIPPGGGEEWPLGESEARRDGPGRAAAPVGVGWRVSSSRVCPPKRSRPAGAPVSRAPRAIRTHSHPPDTSRWEQRRPGEVRVHDAGRHGEGPRPLSSRSLGQYMLLSDSSNQTSRDPINLFRLGFLMRLSSPRRGPPRPRRRFRGRENGRENRDSGRKKRDSAPNVTRVAARKTTQRRARRDRREADGIEGRPRDGGTGAGARAGRARRSADPDGPGPGPDLGGLGGPGVGSRSGHPGGGVRQGVPKKQGHGALLTVIRHFGPPAVPPDPT